MKNKKTKKSSAIWWMFQEFNGWVSEDSIEELRTFHNMAEDFLYELDRCIEDEELLDFEDFKGLWEEMTGNIFIVRNDNILEEAFNKIARY